MALASFCLKPADLQTFLLAIDICVVSPVPAIYLSIQKEYNAVSRNVNRNFTGCPLRAAIFPRLQVTSPRR